MLKLENVHIRRGDYVVADNIDLTLEQGKVYSVLGPNGTGKSSLMKTIFGEVAHKGTIRYGDEALSKIHLQSWRKRIGYMPQDTAAEASLTALEVVLLGRMDALRHARRRRATARSRKYHGGAGHGHLAHRDVMRLSGGQRQLVMFAQVMLRRPEILMLDEPVSALDMHHQLNLLERVVQYTHEHNLVTLMVLHDLSLAAQFSDGVILLGEGKVQAQGAPQDVLQADMIGRLYKVDIELLYDSKGLPVIRPMRKSA